MARFEIWFEPECHDPDCRACLLLARIDFPSPSLSAGAPSKATPDDAAKTRFFPQRTHRRWSPIRRAMRLAVLIWLGTLFLVLAGRLGIFSLNVGAGACFTAAAHYINQEILNG